MADTDGSSNNTTSDRVAGALLILFAVLTAFESRSFTVGFVTDPLGPKAFPLVSAFLLLVGGLALQIRPSSESSWTGKKQLMRVTAAGLCLFAYALVMGVLGFFTATLLAATVFALLLGGRPIASLISATGISAVLYVLFAYVLDIALPIGSLFVRGG